MAKQKQPKRIKFVLPYDCYNSLMGVLDTIKKSYQDVHDSGSAPPPVKTEAIERSKAVKGIIWEIKKSKREID